MISRAHSVIFVHIPKCGGQTLEMLFLNDLRINWSQRELLCLKYNEDKQRGPERLAHLFAKEYKDFEYVSEHEFNSFFKFAVVRNPFSRIVSELNFRKISRRGNCAKDYIKHASKLDIMSDIRRHVIPQVDYVRSDHGSNILVDQIYKLEEFEHWFENFALKSRLDCRKTIIKNRSRFSEWSVKSLSLEDREFIFEFYRDDFEEFGYKNICI